MSDIEDSIFDLYTQENINIENIINKFICFILTDKTYGISKFPLNPLVKKYIRKIIPVYLNNKNLPCSELEKIHIEVKEFYNTCSIKTQPDTMNFYILGFLTTISQFEYEKDSLECRQYLLISSIEDILVSIKYMANYYFCIFKGKKLLSYFPDTDIDKIEQEFDSKKEFEHILGLPIYGDAFMKSISYRLQEQFKKVYTEKLLCLIEDVKNSSSL